MPALPDISALICPYCDAPLRRRAGSLYCPEGHNFDIAREGYVNLLPPQHRIRGITGDQPPMLRARRRFLEAGYYAPLLHLLIEKTADALHGDTASIAELGCGEGYYIGGIGERLKERVGVRPSLFGMDLSKAAARLAARRYPDVTFFVGDINQRIYLRRASQRVLLNIFAPRNPIEFARILEPGGQALIVIPADAHLSTLRAQFGLLGIQEEKEKLTLERLAAYFRQVERTELRYPLQLPTAAVADLIAMGPNQWHRVADQEPPGEHPPVATEAAFIILRFERKVDKGRP